MGYKYIKEVEPARPAAGDKPSASAVYERPGYEGLAATPVEGIKTLADMFAHSVKTYPNRPCLGKRVNDGPFVYETYKEIGAKVDAMGSALVAKGIPTKASVGVLGANCPDWMVTMQACNRQALKCVPLYDTLGANAVEFIINHSEAVAVFVEGKKFSVVAEVLDKFKGQIKLVAYWGEAPEAELAKVKALGMDLMSFDELLELGKSKPSDPVHPSPEDLCTIMYTSGTTGDPKGVHMTHANVLAEIQCAKTFTESIGLGVTSEDVFLSYLPLAHIFDRAVEEYFLAMGACVGYWRGDIKGLVEDIGACKPTMFVGVPRVFDRIYNGILAKMKASVIKNALFHYGYNRKKHFMEKGFSQKEASPFFDKILFSKIKAALGGNVKLIISGAAPLSKHVEEFLKVCMMCEVAQGFGLTETMAGSFIALPESLGGNVGPPLPLVQLRLESVPDMNYDAMANPPRGEVLIRAPTVFKGYHKRQDLTDEVLEKEGWFHTGDVGEITPEGFLKIIDRKKNIFKLSQGEYIAVEKVEGVFKKYDTLDQIWVYGNSFKSVLVAVAVPNQAKLEALAKELKVSGSFAELCANDAIKKAVVAGLTAVGKENGLKGFEAVKAVHLETTPFDVSNDLLTPTFKMKRPQLLKHYQAQVDAMYVALGQ